jgi:hypothetical protein
MREVALLFACVLIVGTAIAAMLKPAKAQSGHERWHPYYMHWNQPGTTVSCCQARVVHPWGETGDCEPTRAELRNGDWYAWERHLARWIRIPDDRIVRERNPSGEEAHLCWLPSEKPDGNILCFVPPDTGG